MILDTLSLKGELAIFSKGLDGRKTLLHRDPNLIVDAAKIAILTSLYTSGIPSRAINTLRVGTGGTIDPEGLYVKPTLGTQTSLNNQAEVSVGVPYEFPLTAVPNASNTRVTFVTDITYGVGVGLRLTEAALYCGRVSDFSPPVIFSVKNHPGIIKSAEFSLHYEWTIRM